MLSFIKFVSILLNTKLGAQVVKRSCFLERLFKDAMFMLALNYLHICAYIYIYMFIYIRVHTRTHTHICIFMYIYVCVHTFTYFRNYNELHWFPFAFNVLSSLKTDDIKGMGVKLYCF